MVMLLGVSVSAFSTWHAGAAEWGLSGVSCRSLFVVLDSLACTDGAISAAAQGWLVRALSLGDVARILEPILLLLLQPKTQRTSIHCLKRENSAGEHPAEPRRGRPGGLRLLYLHGVTVPCKFMGVLNI